jgi:transposase
MSPRRPYATDLSDARWALIEPTLTAWRQTRAQAGLGLSEPVHDLREIVNAILYVNRAGCAWHLLPHDLPPYQTVFGYFRDWEKDGTTELVHDLLRRKVRKAAGRGEDPTAAIMDAQSVKTSANVPESEQGIDANKKIKGRKRHITTDTLGLLLVILITAASVHDTTGGRAMITQLAARHPAVTKAWVDQGYKRSVAEAGVLAGIEVEVVTKDPRVKGFSPTVRWPVERTFGWIMQHRRLVRDFETRPEHSKSMIHWAMIDNMSKRLTGESTQTWRDNAPAPDISTAL